MSVLLLRLAGPMQSWGTQSRFSIRDTGREPSKSGVVGLLCAALGRPRTDPVDDLAALRMGVRVDREGTVAVDYQTAGGTHRRDEEYGVARADGSRGGTVVSSRYYLSDADFLVGLEGSTREQEELLCTLDGALQRPVWPLFLGRKAFVPGVSVRLPDAPPLGPGRREGGLEDVLKAYPWPEPAPHRLRLILDSASSTAGEVRADVPVSFAIHDRRYATRYVETRLIARPSAASEVEA